MGNLNIIGRMILEEILKNRALGFGLDSPCCRYGGMGSLVKKVMHVRIPYKVQIVFTI